MQKKSRLHWLHLLLPIFCLAGRAAVMGSCPVTAALGVPSARCYRGGTSASKYLPRTSLRRGGLSQRQRKTTYNRARMLRAASALFERGGDAHSKDETVHATDEYEIDALTQQQRPSPVFSVPSYYLVWSRGVWKRILAGLAFLHLLRSTIVLTHCQFHGIVNSLPASTKWLIDIVVLPLLSSACCGIQLLINALVGASGCAGFNTYLGPLRPYFLSILLYSSASSVIGRSGDVRWMIRTALSCLIALMPEVVCLWNNLRKKRWRRRQQTNADTVKATVSIAIPSMGCVACINKIDASLHKAAPDRILDAQSWLSSAESQKGGNALIKLSASSENEIKSLSRTLVWAVRAAGFDTCMLESIKIEN